MLRDNNVNLNDDAILVSIISLMPNDWINIATGLFHTTSNTEVLTDTM